ncbi:tRNA lysidine(34) synthetase TilS [Aurantiacibacter sp. MUD61]|uniref:tRNA lysidine(34) synthetase TilS n=1 Tax=Aurantiacibacter sp. MUD61 TaxID=3009083 RepID=UPI0022F0A7C3|nr:tRNA lysidine(34) synthetase TilS [Aurantiacibacter sp. MUD61]
MVASTAIDPELVARFKAALDRLNPDGGKIGLAVSGGPDSMAMLLLAQEAIPGQFEVATVDHGLRSEATDECALVVAACKERGVPCEVLTVQVGEGNVQANARGKRYRALDDWAVDRSLSVYATAHHADDQAETLLMRLNRGSGVSGLAGVREWVHFFTMDVPVMRPLLTFRKAELAQIASVSGVPFCSDPSNEDESFDRVRIRHALRDADWLDPIALARSASRLAEAEETLEAVTNDAMAKLVTREGEIVRCTAPMDREIGFRLVGRIIKGFGKEARGQQIADLLDRLENCRGGNVAGVMATVEGRWGGSNRPTWIFSPEPPRRTG